MTEKPDSQLLKEDQFSKVWRQGKYVYKRQHEFLTDNEIWFLRELFPFGYVPFAEQIDRDLIRMKFIPMEPVTDPDLFMSHKEPVLYALTMSNTRHGDLTVYALRVRNNRPYLIDFAEARLFRDPRPDKRPEGDRYWLTKSMEELCDKATGTD